MTTANDIVTPALQALGVHSEVLPADPSLFEVGRKRLVSLLEDLAADSIELGTTDDPIVLPTTLATDIDEQNGARQGLIDVLAQRLCGPTRTPETGEINREATRGLRDLKRRFRVQETPNIVPSRLMPIGSGRRGYLGQTFFDGTALADDSSTTT